MKRKELIDQVEKQGNLAHKEAKIVVYTCFESIIRALYNDRRIEIRTFGSFGNKNYKSYGGRNPKSEKKVNIKPRKVPFFRACQELKTKINANRHKYAIKKV